MSLLKNVKERRGRRKLRVARRIKNDTTLPRISVFRSSSNIYAQLINDALGTTLASCSSVELKGLSGDKKAIARSVGLELAKRAHTAGIEQAVFDRGHFMYHGRIAALADGLREGGLKV